MAPVDDVLSMEMLLCFILQYLEPDDILRCRSVCSYFNQVIQTSSMVKQACYYPSISNSKRLSSPPGDMNSTLIHDGYTMNPLLRKRFTQFFKVAEDNTGLWERWRNPRSPKGRLAREAAVMAEASWRSMLVSRPTLTRLGVLYIIPRTLRRGHYNYKHEILDYPRGLTMDVLYGLVMDHLQWPGTDFALDWSNALAGSEEAYDVGMLTRRDTYWINQRVRPQPPPMYPPPPELADLTALSSVSVTLLLRGRPGFHARKRADKVWVEKWSLRSASQPVEELPWNVRRVDRK